MNHFGKILVSAAVVLPLISTAAGQTAAPVSCGAVVTSSVTLSGNLHCPGLGASGAALTIVAPGVAVDLNGYTISGTGAGYGILVPGPDKVTIRNGEVREFRIGIAAVAAGPDLVYSLSISRVRAIGNATFGILLSSVRFSEVRDSEISLNGSDGILVWNDSSYNTIANNIVSGHPRAGITAGCDPYSSATNPGKPSNCDGKHATENVIERNTVVYNGWMAGGPAGQSGIGLIFADRTIVRNNLVTDGHTNGTADQDVATGIVVVGGTDNQILKNRTINNGAGIVVSQYGEPPAYAVNTVVSGNVSLRNASGGIVVSVAGCTGAVITDNFTASNGAAPKTGLWFECHSGICADGDNAVLSSNLATDNAEYGIAVTSKSPQAFGNRALRNAKAAQCSGLSCAMASAAAGQTASPVACGATVTSNLTLTGNLSCPGLKSDASALIVAGNGVTLDLNGYTVSGTGNGVGILVLGADNVTVRNGDVRGFGVGVMGLAAGPDRVYSLSVSRIRATGNAYGIFLDGVRFSEIRDSEASENLSDGIVVFNDSSYNTLAGNLVTGNARSGIGVVCEPYSAAKNPGNPANCDGKRPFENLVEGNTLVNNAYVAPGAGQTAIGLVFADRNTVRDNLVADSHSAAPREKETARGIFVGPGTDNQILHNHVLNSGAGIMAASYGSPKAWALNTVIAGNTALHNAAGGIMVLGAEARGAVICDNFVAANGAYERTGFSYQCRGGICAQGENAVLMNNLAPDNAEYGILVESESPVQSGNRAMRNGKEQCSGLTCRQ